MSAPQFDIPPPPRLAHFPRDHRGFIVPYFVQWFDHDRPSKPGRGAPDFRVVDPHAFQHCVRFSMCWLCGQPLSKRTTFVLGPMCVITRTNSEPGSHRDCAEYAMKVCPFLTKPNMRRNSGYDVPVVAAPGEHSEANPGIMALWITSGARAFRAEQGVSGVLFEVDDPIEPVQWWREGRPATHAEVVEGMARAMPALEASAARQGREAIMDLERKAERALAHLPKE